MRTHATTAAVVLTAVLFVAPLATACSGSSDEPDKNPRPSSTAPKIDKREAVARCTDAVAEAAAAADEAPSEEDMPKQCAPLSDRDYLDAYADGLAKANQQARDALGDELDGSAPGTP